MGTVKPEITPGDMMPLKKYYSFILLLFTFLTVCAATAPPVQSRMNRHMVIYGGLKDADLPQVAENADILVLDYIRRPLLERLKVLNPDLILLKYQHGIGFHPSYPAWREVDQHENWFMHDAESQQRLIERKYGWYLMDISSDAWKQFWAETIIENTDPMFDGIFIDDCWNRFVPKFNRGSSTAPGRPATEIITRWSHHLNAMLTHVKAKYGGLVYVNGAHPEYLPVVDGCMEEGFIHASWVSDRKMPDAETVVRTLLRIESLKSFGKPILLQSGTLGDHPLLTQAVYDYCRTAYRLVAGQNTYFGFHPYPGYAYKGIFPDNDLEDPGRPLEPMQLTETIDLAPNLVPNGDFQNGLSPWKVLSGRPQPITAQGPRTHIIHLESRSGNSDRIISPFIPVKENFTYELAVRCKAQLNRSVGAGYRKLGLQGRFYDQFRRKLPGAYDLQFDEGSYDWLAFGRTVTSPPQAAYFQIRIGFIGDGTGRGWVDRVRLAPAQQRALVIKREFQSATVILNAGQREAMVLIDRLPPEDKRIFMSAGQGKVVQHRVP